MGRVGGEDGGPRGMVQARLALMVTESGVGVGSGNLVNYSREEMGLGRGTAGRGVARVGGASGGTGLGFGDGILSMLVVNHDKNKHFEHGHLVRTLLKILNY